MVGTIEINGTGGILEGNLGTAAVNVNLDTGRQFDGADDYISTANSATLENLKTFTYAFWIYHDTASTRDNIIYKSTNIQMEITSGDCIEGFRRYNTTNDRVTTSTTVPAGSWNHVAWTATAAAAAPKIYINGVEAAYATQTAGAGSDTDDSGGALEVGGYSSGSLDFGGKIADFRIYNAALSADNIAVLASKINTDSSLGAGTTNLKLWHKLDGTEAAGAGNVPDDSPQSNVGTLNGTSVDYDAFSVNVQDNTTTTDGAVTVTQGKLEGLSLSSTHLDGSADYMGHSGFSLGTAWTISGWIYPDDISGEECIYSNMDSTTDGIQIQRNSGSLRCKVNAEGIVDCGLDLVAAQWQHIVWTYDNSTLTGYINGVAGGTTGSFSETHSVGGDGNIGRLRTENSQFFDGKVNDFKVFTSCLSADQVSSLYSGSYNVTPEYWWKLDEGTGTTVEDYGVGTDKDGTLQSSPPWSNGTLDLDAELFVKPNGTLSAPRGELNLNLQMGNEGTFTHNNGTVLFSGAASYFIDQDASTHVDPAFYNLTYNAGGATYLQETITVENLFNITSGSIKLTSDKAIKLGTTSASGTLQLNSIQGLTPYGDAHIEGISSLYPAIITGSHGTPILWGYGEGGANHIRLKNVDIQFAVVTDGDDDVTLTLTGDCEFDDVTVSSGDTLDLNGQRVQVDNLTNSGTIDLDGMIFCIKDITLNGTVNNKNLGTIVNRNTSNKVATIPDGTYGGLHILGSNQISLDSAQDLGTTPVTVGSTNSSDLGYNLTCGNLTIPTGGTLDGSADTLTVAGDFTTSGGLLGPSCLQVVSANNEYAYNSGSQWGGMHDAFTVEFWFKTSTSGVNYLLDYYNGTNENNRIRLYTDGSNDVVAYAHNSSGTGSPQITTSGITASTNDGKWHHVAFTSSGTELKLYYDGKLANQTTATVDRDNDPTMRLEIGKVNGSTAYNFDGEFDELRFFSDVRTEAELRANMFVNVHGDISGDALAARYGFNEGTGTAVDNSQGTASRDLVLYNNDGTEATDLWAGAGTFDISGAGDPVEYPTLVMAKSGTQYINFIHGEDVHNLTINDGSTTELVCTDEVAGTLDMYGDLVVNEKLRSASSGSTNTGIKMREEETITVGSDVRTTALSDLYSLSINHSSGTISIPECTIPRIYCNNSTTQATGDLTITEELEVGSGTTFNANGNTIAAKVVDVNGGTLNLSNSALNFSVTSSGDLFDMNDASTLTTGNTTITGNSSASRTSAILPAAGGFEVVGDVKWLRLYDDGDVTVIGSVIDCDYESGTTGGNFRQWHHTLDTQQLLDADEAGDDDLRLTKPTLDNSHELQTG